MSYSLDVVQIKKHFSRAAKTYSDAAGWQWEVAKSLAAMVADESPKHWLDLGAGTGFLGAALKESFAGSNSTACDIAQSMLSEIHEANYQHRICADAHHLPFAGAQFDLVAANLMIQWGDVLRILKQVHQVLTPGGRFALTTLGPGTLRALGKQRIHKFYSESEYLGFMAEAGFTLCQFKREVKIVATSGRLETIRRLKKIGAMDARRDRPRGLRRSPALLAEPDFEEVYNVYYFLLEVPAQ